MKASAYAAKRNAGICAASIQCQKPATRGVLCADHRKKSKVAVSKSRSRLYYERKLAGLCVGHGCSNPSRPDAVYCSDCAKKCAVQHRKYYATPEAQELSKASARAYRKQRARKGLCLRCRNKRVTKLYCEEHRKKFVDYWHGKKAGNRVKWRHCSRCGEGGHDVRICQKPAVIDRALPPLPPLRIEDFASARMEAA
jgi:hypothetical protein